MWVEASGVSCGSIELLESVSAKQQSVINRPGKLAGQTNCGYPLRSSGVGETSRPAECAL